MGSEKEPASDELRQAQPLHQAVLQEGNHSQTRCVSETGLSVCPSSMSPTPDRDKISACLLCTDKLPKN